MSQPLDHSEESALEEPTPPAAPITSRFLFVDVAAQRAKQLRRGALPRVDRSLTAAPAPHKLERVAMEEVRTGLIHYSLPTTYEGAGHNYAVEMDEAANNDVLAFLEKADALDRV